MSLFIPTAGYFYQDLVSAILPPAFYTSSFGSNTITPFFAINDGGYDSVTGKWKQWGSISGSLPSLIGASSSVASGSGTITYDGATGGYIFNNKHIYWTGSVGVGPWIRNSSNGSTVNWNEQQFALFFQGVIPTTATLATNYIASSGRSSITTFYGWDLTWNTGSVVWQGGAATNNIDKKKFMSGSFVPGTKYNVMFLMGYGANSSLRYGNMFYAAVDANGTSQAVTQSSTGPYNFGGSDGYNYVTYFYDATNGSTEARVGQGTVSAGAAGLINSASIHSFMMYSFPQYPTVPLGSLITFAGTPNSASVGADSYIQQIFNSASLTWVTT